jgi:hypothetical protein
VTLSETFPTCTYGTMFKLMLDNKQRQPEQIIFKAASKWILADHKRVEVADDVFGALGISSATVQSLLQQNALSLLQPGCNATGEGGMAFAELEAAQAGGLLSRAAGQLQLHQVG